ncbi:hypothetical protein OQA88_12695 [Cercophora sp. LCS_1]
MGVDRGYEANAALEEHAGPGLESFNQLYVILNEFAEKANDWLRRKHNLDDQSIKAMTAAVFSNKQVLKYAASCTNQLAGRRGLFFTREGQFGTGPTEAAKGDKLVVIDGVSLPMVLRQQSERQYLVLGPAYVLGLAFVSEVESPEKGWEDKPLCELEGFITSWPPTLGQIVLRQEICRLVEREAARCRHVLADDDDVREPADGAVFCTTEGGYAGLVPRAIASASFTAPRFLFSCERHPHLVDWWGKASVAFSK